jgi:hypothetical protein
MLSLLLKAMPMLDDIDIVMRQRGDQSHGMHIPETDAAASRGSADTTTSLGKGKEKIAPSEPASKAYSNTETSSEDMAPLVRRMRQVRSNGSTTDAVSLPGQ